jgi:hypothetical protein
MGPCVGEEAREAFPEEVTFELRVKGWRRKCEQVCVEGD